MSVVERDDPGLPPELLEGLSKGECVLFAGAGLSARAGLPTRKALLTELLKTAASTVGPELVSSLTEALEDGALDLVSEGLASALAGNPQIIQQFLTSVYGTSTGLSDAHRLMSNLPFNEILTTNYDRLLETTFPPVAKSGLYTPADADLLLDAKAQKRAFLLKLYGTPERPETLMLSSLQYAEGLNSNIPFANFIQGLFFSRTFLFIGLSPEEIQGFLQGFTFHESSQRRHFAFLTESGASRARLSLLERKFGVIVAGMEVPGGPLTLERFLQRVLSSIAPVSPARESAPPASTPTGIRRLILEDIGSFERLELDFPRDKQWKVLLGDNGVGKSTVLKAIAVAMMGSDARSFAGRLVRVGKTRGRITVFTDLNPHGYVTEILPKDMISEAEVISRPSRFLEAEGLLALGFSPLRVVTWSASLGPQEILQKGRPTVDDLVPLLSGEFDPRMDRLKQWIVNLDAADKARQITSFIGHEVRVSAVLFSSDGRTMISGDLQGMVRIWDSWTGKETRNLRAHQHGINAIALSGDGLTLGTASFDKTVRLWDLSSGRRLKQIDKHGTQVLSLALNFNAKTVVSGTDYGSVRVWDFPFNEPRERFGDKGNSVWSIALAPNSERIYAAFQSGAIRSYDLNGQPLKPLKTDGSPAWSIAVNNSDTQLVSGMENGSVVVFDLDSGMDKVMRSRGSEILSVAISADGKFVAAGSKDGHIRVWDTGTTRELLSVKAHSAEVWSIALSPDGHSVVSGAGDGTLKLWSIPNDEGTSLATIRKFFEVVGILTDRKDIDFLRVTENFRVFVRTEDIPEGIPLEVLSQGLTSLLSWVGVLCQRMKETSQQGQTSVLPTEGPAIVLIDELDAHMHPRWQQMLVRRLKQLFPKVQFIACTHSPLIVGGLDKAEVERFQIVDGKVEKMEFDSDMTLGRTDQILTGELFSLRTTLDPETQEQMGEYKRLLGKSNRTDEEQKEFLRLSSVMENRIPPSPSDLLPRRARELLEVLDHEFIGTVRDKKWSPKGRVEISRRMAALEKTLKREASHEEAAQ
jgi:WD40 repeat protein